MEQYRHIDTTGLPKGFDVADLIASGVVGDQLKAWCKERIRPGPPRLSNAERAGDYRERQKAAQPEKGSYEAQLAKPDDNIVSMPEPKEDKNGIPIEFSEDSLSALFTERHKKTLAYCGAWTAWTRWNGAIWQLDDTGYALDQSRQICREKALEAEQRIELANKRKVIATTLSSRKCIANVEQIARSDPHHTVRPSQFDADPWILNTPGGVINLKTGSMRAPRREDWCTKSTAIAPANEKCPHWIEFLKTSMRGDDSLIRYLQRIAGYCLTGSIAEHVFFFCYGTGGNGKGTYLNQLYWMLNDYAVQANMDTFTEQRFTRHAAEIAVFQGARLIAASETQSGQRWNESRIKSLTGGDPITANFMRQNPFTFLPTFKLLFAGNHKPHLRNVDAAIKRRMYLIPFEHEVSEAEKDTLLPDKLQAEGAAILNWAIEGCMDWQENSLNPPPSVIATTSEYFENEDKIGSFLEDCTVSSLYDRCSSTRLYDRYVRWCDGAGEYAGTRKDFLELMRLKGYVSIKRNGVMAFDGLDIRPEGGLY